MIDMSGGSIRRAIRIFRAEPMSWTDFESDTPPGEFVDAGIEYVANAFSADIVLAGFAAALVPFGRLPKRFAIWTFEPRYDLHRRPIVHIPNVLQPVHVMNAHTGAMFTDNYFGMWSHAAPLDRDRAIQAFRAKPRRAAMLATYRKRSNWLQWRRRTRAAVIDRQSSLVLKADGSLLLDGRNLDLNQRRQALGEYLYRKRFCDIFGRGWPKRISISGESRFGEWVVAKQAILARYSINIALENTIVPHYVTEKIWDAIKAACLPVYHGLGNRIYDDFPLDSFIEVGEKDFGTLADEIMLISESEACDRYERCLTVYNRVIGEGRAAASAADRRRRTVEFLQCVRDQPLTA